ncbi:hypothetical protein JGUZn3_11430 [Entomobacter blattae]|uniref:Uncharacterized protein n=1 Tax=Entomobacter blattae TaxID=2762277 RepID=A0A7H1NRG0_9PROT|nr:hypothetical protein JGUZn3_11430 [Entomobacter blattae]
MSYPLHTLRAPPNLTLPVFFDLGFFALGFSATDHRQRRKTFSQSGSFLMGSF